MTLHPMACVILEETPRTEPSDECVYLRDGRRIVLTQIGERLYDR